MRCCLTTSTSISRRKALALTYKPVCKAPRDTSKQQQPALALRSDPYAFEESLILNEQRFRK